MEIVEYIDTLDKKIYKVGEKYKDLQISKLEINTENSTLDITTGEVEHKIKIVGGMCKNKEGQLFKLAPDTNLN